MATTPSSSSADRADELPGDEPAAHPIRRRRRATAASTAPEHAPEVAPQPAPRAVEPPLPAVEDAAPSPAAEEPAAEAAVEAPRPVRRRRRATAGVTVPSEAPAAPAQPELPQAEPVLEAVAEPEDTATGAEASAIADEPATEPASAEEAAEDEAAEPAEPADDAAPSADEAASEEAASEDEASEEADDEPRLPAASLLFQAPDPSRSRRRRRATAGVTAPSAAEPAPAAETRTAETGSEDAADEATPGSAASAETAEPSVTGAQAEEAPRGRGRRRRRASAPSTTPDHVEDAPAAERVEDSSEETAPAEDADAADSAGSEDSEESRDSSGRRKRRRGGRGRRSRSRSDERSGDESEDAAETDASAEDADSDSDAGEASDSGDTSESSSSRRRRRRRSRSDSGRDVRDEVTALKGSTRLEAKRQRRREGRAAGRRRPIVTEAEFLARRESVDRQMIIREQDGLNQIAVLEDGLLVEHYVARHTQSSMVGNVYVGRVQNVLPSMEAAFVDLGKGRNAVLYAGEVNWDAAGMEGKPRRIEDALKSGDTVLVQVTKDPIGHKGARLTSQITLAGRYLVLVPGGTMTGISRKLPDSERSRLKKILKRIVPDDAGVIVRTAAEGASEEQLQADVERLTKQWESIDKKSASVLKGSGKAPVLLKGEPELAVRVVRDVFNEDFRKLIVQGPDAWVTISEYVTELSPDLADRLEHWVSPEDVFSAHRIDEQLAKGFDRKVWLPSGGTLIIDRTEAMTVVDVNTGRFTGAGGTLEETVTRNNLEAAEEIVRQLRLRDIGGMVVIDFVDMVLESNRDLVLRRLVECLGRDRTRHQVTEVTSLGLVQMTRKRVGQGLVEAFSTECECCGGRGFIVHDNPVENQKVDMSASAQRGAGSGRARSGRKGREEEPAATGRGRSSKRSSSAPAEQVPEAESGKDDDARAAVRGALAQIAAAAEHAHKGAQGEEPAGESVQPVETAPASEGTTAQPESAGPVAETAGETVAEAPSSEPVPEPAQEEEAPATKPRRRRRASSEDGEQAEAKTARRTTRSARSTRSRKAAEKDAPAKAPAADGAVTSTEGAGESGTED